MGQAAENIGVFLCGGRLGRAGGRIFVAWHREVKTIRFIEGVRHDVGFFLLPNDDRFWPVLGRGVRFVHSGFRGWGLVCGWCRIPVCHRF